MKFNTLLDEIRSEILVAVAREGKTEVAKKYGFSEKYTMAELVEKCALRECNLILV